MAARRVAHRVRDDALRRNRQSRAAPAMKTFAADCVLRADAILGEGPVWDAARQRLWWVDIERRELHCFDPVDGTDRAWHLEHRIGFAVPTTRGDLVIGTQRGLLRFDPGSGAITP